MLYTSWGDLFHAGRSSHWEGQPEYAELKEGDVVVRLPPPPPLHAPAAAHAARGAGHAARLRRGHPDGVGQRRAEGRHGPAGDAGPHQPSEVGRLEGPLRWAVDLDNSSVAVAGPLTPPAA